MADNSVEVRICVGTTCHLFGASDLLNLEEFLSDEIKDVVTIKGEACFGFCKDPERPFGEPPYVKINGNVISNANVEKVAAEISTILEKD